MGKIQEYNAGSVISKDGTVIGYGIMGSGPGVILMPGGANDSQDFMTLGCELADVLLIGGSEGPEFLINTLDELKKVLPNI